jgi:hypothetical protein
VRIEAELTRGGMSVEVQGLAAMVRDAKAAIARAREATTKLGAVSADLATTLGHVEAMTAEIEKAHGELKAEMGGSNVGP